MIEFFKRLKNMKGFSLLLAGLMFGIVLLFVGNFYTDGKSPNESLSGGSDSYENYVKEYTEGLEAKIKRILEKIDGVSDVNVVLTLDSGVESVYAQNKTYSGGTLTSKNYVMANGVTVPVKDVYPQIRGVAVVCKGGSNPIIQEKVISLIRALLGLSSNNVYVTG